MINLIYTSSAVELFREDELVELLKTSRDNNRRRGITGMLLYNDGNFLQVLEGPEESVRALYERIRQDPRHRNIIKLYEKPIDEPEFGQWEMAFRNVSGYTDEIPGYSEFLNTIQTNASFNEKHGSAAYNILMMFKENIR